MADLIDDGSLVGLWPLHEPSGTPSWKNYSPAYGNHPSGVSFDMLGHTADNGSTTDDDSVASPWPGQEVVVNSLSGVIVRGLKLQGISKRLGTTSSAPYSKILVLGNGTRIQRVETLGPAVANSGFTAGFWVYPMSDGWINAATENGFSPGVESWRTGYARTHSLMGQFRNDIGWYMGISGLLDAATPASDSNFGPHQLRGFVMSDLNSSTTAEGVDVPIESGRFTHLTMSYRYVDGTSNVISLYKDGNLVGTSITNKDIVFDASNTSGPDASVFNIGGGTDGTDGSDSLEFANGWGHLVSGVYVFRRVLEDTEVFEMHQRGGLQPDFSLRDNVTKVDITDDHLIAHVEGKAPGWIDASKKHNNFISAKDPGDRGADFVWDPGPFNANRVYHDGGTNTSKFIAAPSGATLEAVTADGGFTICGFFQPQAAANDRDGAMMISMGSVSTAISGPTTPATVSSNTLGMSLSYFLDTGVGDRVTLEVFPVGDGTEGKLSLRSEGEQIWRSTNVHYGIIYDAATQGVALYMDGYEAASGTLTHDLRNQLTNLAGSGYPVMFTNGISNILADVITKGVLANGGRDMTSGPYTMLSRPLRADEMRFMAQSGIDTSPLWKTRYDPRLMGYWPCNTFDLGDIVVDDVARAMSPVTGPLSRGHSNTKWERVYNKDNSRPDQEVFRDDGTARVDLFTGETRSPDSLQQSFGNLGITSGVFAPQGGSPFGGGLSNNVDSRNTPFNAFGRWRIATEERDLGPQSLNEHVIAFEVTPSGDIPKLEATSQAAAADQRWFNSRLHTYGNLALATADGEFSSFLTTLDEASGSGVTVCFVARDGTSSANIVPVMSGTLPYGVPSKVLLHTKFDEPYRVNGFITGNTPVTVSLWIDGQKVNQRTDTAIRWRMWSDQVPDGTTSDWALQFGGYASQETATINVSADAGLGEIYMREMFIMRGVFETGEIEALATSGIQSPTIAGFTAQLPTTQVTISDSNLEGYWRFNGFDGNVGQVTNSPGGSGTTDLSLKGNHLDAIAQRFYEQGTSVDLAETMRVVSGPHKNSDLGVQCSGFHNQSIVPNNASPNMLPPFAVSGTALDAPADGFSVGFLMAKRDDVATSAFDCMLCYGVLTAPEGNGSVVDVTIDPNRGWAIGMDDTEQIKMIVSTGGNMYLDGVSNGANSGQIVCGMTNTNNPLKDFRSFNKWKQGDYRIPAIDFWDHYCWTYDPSTAGGSGVRCYLNGNLVDERFVPQDKINPWTGTTVAPQTPVEPTARMMTVRSHQTAGHTPAAWNFRNVNLVDVDSVMTDLFYFSRPLAESEVRYIAQHGIDAQAAATASGTIGGFVHGQDTGSGHMGGLVRGLSTGSGYMGGFIPGGSASSGHFGGYVSGVVFGDGTLGGFVRGLDTVSGIAAGYIHGVDIGSGMIAGYIAGQDVGSGYFGGLVVGVEITSGVFGGYIRSASLSSGQLGGFMLGGLQGNFEFDGGFTVEVMAAKDFDAQLEIAKTVSSDFDAKVIIFQDEAPPTVEISIPAASISGLAPPFNQYFIGKASGTQGKTIVSTKWTFGDFSPTASVAESGAGCYPIQHMYASSGFYIAKFEAIDSDGLHGSDTLIVNAASGIDPVIVSLSGVPRSGDQALIVDFTTTVDILPPGVSLSASLLSYDDGQTASAFNPTHTYTQPGTYKPIWCVRDSRGVTWCDSLEEGNDFLQNGGA